MRLVRCPCGCGHVFDADAEVMREYNQETFSSNGNGH